MGYYVGIWAQYKKGREEFQRLWDGFLFSATKEKIYQILSFFSLFMIDIFCPQDSSPSKFHAEKSSKSDLIKVEYLCLARVGNVWRTSISQTFPKRSHEIFSQSRKAVWAKSTENSVHINLNQSYSDSLQY